MSKFFSSRTLNWVYIILIICLPFIIFWGRLFSYQMSITDLYPLSVDFLNDEVFYYLQIQNVIEYGEPLGYWGYNEGHASIGNFAAWGPFILIPHLVLGKLLGWHLFSPMLYNLLFMTFTLTGVYFLLKPKKRELLLLSIFMSFGSLFLFYSLTAMMEIPQYCIGIFIGAVLVKVFRTGGGTKIFGGLFALLIFASLTRFYWAIFFFPASALYFKKSPPPPSLTY